MLLENKLLWIIVVLQMIKWLIRLPCLKLKCSHVLMQAPIEDVLFETRWMYGHHVRSAPAKAVKVLHFLTSILKRNLVGINEDKVSAVLNTIARMGVIEKQHFGGNSWHTPYGPICLHEQYIAQMGLAINDNSYLKGYQQCLDFYRDNAIKQDGRVWPRWAYSNESCSRNSRTFYLPPIPCGQK